MRYRVIAQTNLKVSLLGFGNFVVGSDWWGRFDDDQAERLQNAAVDAGVNFFDTAPAYGHGLAEQRLRRTIQYAGRDNLVISTKFGYDLGAPLPSTGHRERPQDFSARAIQRQVERSLQRMDIDCIDLYQAHNIKLPQMQDELFEALQRLVEQGKIRYWGVALGPAIGWLEEGLAAIDRGSATVQTVFNLYEQQPGRALCDATRRAQRGGVIVRVPTNSGMLDEEFTSPEHRFDANDHRKFRDRDWLIFGLKKNQAIAPIAQAESRSIRQLAFAYLMRFEQVVSIEPNLLTPADVRDFAEAASLPNLSQRTLDQLDTLYANDFYLGQRAHPCDLKSSVMPGGKIRSPAAFVVS